MLELVKGVGKIQGSNIHEVSNLHYKGTNALPQSALFPIAQLRRPGFAEAGMRYQTHDGLKGEKRQTVKKVAIDGQVYLVIP